MNDVEAALKTEKEIPLKIILFRDLHKCFGPLPSAAHEFFLGRWGVAYPAVHFEGYQFEFGAGRKRGGENFEGLLHGVELRAALAADSDGDFGHSLPGLLPDCNGNLYKFSRRIFGGLRKTRRKECASLALGRLRQRRMAGGYKNLGAQPSMQIQLKS